MNSGLILFTGNFVLGTVVWAVPSALAGWAPAWEGDPYFVFGLPMVILSSAACAYKAPEHSWRWPVGSVAGQALMMIADPSGDWELELYMPENRAGHVRSYREANQEEKLEKEYKGLNADG